MTDDEKRIELLTKWNMQMEETIQSLQWQLKQEKEYSFTLKKENEQLKKNNNNNRTNSTTYIFVGMAMGLSIATMLNILIR